MTTILFLGCGIWCLYFGVRGINPRSWNPVGQKEAGQPMRLSTRVIYCVGGVLVTGSGEVLWLYLRGK